MKLIKRLIGILLIIVFLMLYLWSLPAIYFLLLNLGKEVCVFVLILYVLLLAPVVFPGKKKDLRRLSLYILCTIITLLIIYYYFKEPDLQYKADWEPSFAKSPQIEIISKDKILIRNIRNFKYESVNKFKVEYYSKTVNINDLQKVYYILSYWDGNKAIAHSMISFRFKGDSFLCFSNETRLRKGQPQDAFRSLYKQYPIIHIIGNENDLLRLRINYRKEKVYVYPLKMNRIDEKDFFMILVNEIIKNTKKPIYYNLITENCLTSVVREVFRTREVKPIFDIRFFLNGYSDKMAYEYKAFSNSKKVPFDKYKEKHNANKYVDMNTPYDKYSILIRPELNQKRTAEKQLP